jgi:hypothetical protein
MHGLKTTIGLAVVLIGLGAYIYFVDSTRPPAGEEQREKVFTVKADEIEELQVKAADGQTSQLTKSGTTWTLNQPVKADADATELSSLTSGLESLEIQRVVEEKAADLTPYGLSQPRLEVAFRTAGQKDLRRLLIGDKTPTGGDLYAKQLESQRVFLIPAYLENTFNKTAFDFRDKGVLKFETDKVDGLEITAGAMTKQFSKSGMDWRIVKPLAVRGDYGAIEALVSRLQSGRMQKMIAEGDDNLKQYGLDPPSLRVSVSTGSSRATLLIGRAEGDAFYAKDLTRPTIFTVEQAFPAEFEKDASEFRQKDAFAFRSFTAHQIAITRNGMKSGFERSVDKDGKEVWRDITGRVVETMKVEDLANRLSGLRAESFETTVHPSLKMPVMVVTAGFNEKDTETVTFGRSGMDVYANRPDEPGSMKLNTSSFDEMMKVLDAMK